MNNKKGNWPPVKDAAIARSIERCFRLGSMDHLTLDAYNFVINMDGFIAHYNINGFRAYYSDLRDFADKILRGGLLAGSTREDEAAYCMDADFIKEYGEARCASKARAIKAIVSLTQGYRAKTETQGAQNDKNEIELLAECVKRARGDATFARQFLSTLLR